MQDSILGVIDLPLREAPEGAKNLPFAKGMPMMVVYVIIMSLVLFPFGASASSIREQGFDSGMPLEEMYLASLILIGLSILLLFFYRDPYREIQDGIVSPADGLVQKVDKHSGMIYISIFMGPQNVHVNRSPIDGTVLSQKHMDGGNLPAFSKDSDQNERLVTKLETDIGVFKVTQIAGFLVRRIVSYVEPKSRVSKGERIGLIHFGSRVDLRFEAAGIDIKVSEGDRVLAGQTLAIFTPLSSLSVAEKIIEGPKRLLSKIRATAEGD
jgi:phosphatidylserine decarboxylase